MEPPFDDLKARYIALPNELKDTISSREAAEALYHIGTANGLRIDEMDMLSKQTGLVLLGVTHPNDFVARLRDALPMSRDKVPAIAGAVSEQIFAPIHDMLIAAHKKDAPPQAASEPTAIKSVPRTLGADITQAKMSGTFRLPPDTITVKAPAPTPKATPAAPVRDGKYASIDPYREPTN